MHALRLERSMEIDLAEAKPPPPPPPPPTRSLEVRLYTGDPPRAETATSSHDSWPPEDHYRLRRVPQWVRDAHEQLYSPKFMCFGPYHSSGDRLLHEELKLRYATELLQDPGDPQNTASRDVDQLAQSCEQSLRTMISQIREFYAEDKDMTRTDDDALVKMMFLDGCFIIKHLYNYASGLDEEELHQTRWAPAQLRSDLTLLENQIPFAVLVALFKVLAPRKLQLHGADEKRKRRRLLDLALWYMFRGCLPSMKRPTDILLVDPDVPIDHLLHLLHKAQCNQLRIAQQSRRQPPERPGKVPEPDSKENIPSATELRNALGIKINVAEADELAGGFVLDVHLREDGWTLEVPKLYLEQTTAPLLQNLIAYEQQVGTDGKNYPEDIFTTYAFLMYNLVSTPEDIRLLEEHGILQNNFGSDKKIIKYFKNLCMWNRRTGSTLLDNVLQDLRKLKHKRVYHQRAIFLRWVAEAKNYINTPIKMLLLIISAMVSLSTVLQAFVAVQQIRN